MNTKRSYYEAYDERYKTAHSEGVRWFGNERSPIVGEIVKRYGITHKSKILELGCGEGRDAIALLDRGCDLLATDVSPEAICYCQHLMPTHADRFRVLDCVREQLYERFDFIYAVAVLHMLVLDTDRTAFYRFIRDHLADGGVALISTMGDGIAERSTDIRTAFELQERDCKERTLTVASTSCRIVTDIDFDRELAENGLLAIERGQTSVPNEFPEMMYAVVKRTSETQK